ncbi:MAG: hypothetical protein IJH39_00660 [Clostridia bacterium]|nr:hypothetical protein [Clostridia bacterium]
MNWYKKYNQDKKDLLKQADVILEDKEYNSEATGKLYSAVTSHIFSQSKKAIGSETQKYMGILEDFRNAM